MSNNYISFTWEKEQHEHINRAAALLKSRFGASPTAFVQTYGCQQNVSDSERFKGMLSLMGCTLTDAAEDADIILFNTCAVRGHAEFRVYGNIGALKHHKRRRPDSIIIICGCMVQQESVADKIRRSYPYVDLVLGTNAIYKLPELLLSRLEDGPRVFDLDENTAIYEGVPVRRDGSYKGWLPIMYGCNNFCSYCVVPYVRGRERSREPDAIIAEFTEMVNSGYKDITLLGQNVNSYGRGLELGMDFATLLRRINDIPGEFIIRFMTSHPKDCTEELINTIADCDKVERHLHLPFQSGSDRILGEMNRRYDRKKYLSLINMAKDKIEGLTLSTDIIVGFPGETYEDFLETLSLVKEVEFANLFTFIYSPREGTPAAEMDDPIPMSDKKRWFDELLKAQDEIANKVHSENLGKVCRVLCEPAQKSGDGFICGHTSSNLLIEFEGERRLIGEFATVEITETGAHTNKGKLVNNPL